MENLLKEEQERILASLSQVLPESSQTLLNADETEQAKNEGKMFEVHEKGRKVETGKNVSVDKRLFTRKRQLDSRPFTPVKRKLGRPGERTCKPSEKAQPGSDVEENDSGFGTCSEVMKYATPEYHNMEVTQPSDSEDSTTSVESISLLQTASNTAMEVDDLSAGVNLAWNVKVFPPLDDDDDEEMEVKTTTEKSVQTIHVPFHADGNVMHNVNFISSVIRLKQIFSSNATISRNDFENILKRLPETEEPESPEKLSSDSTGDSDEIEVAGEDGMIFIAERRRRRRPRDVISCETVRYVLRKTNAEDVMERSVDSILAWLKEETEKDWRSVCCYWNGSANAEAVDVINEAVDSGDIEIRKKVLDFLTEILNDFHNGPVEDTIAEFKVGFLSNFCKSTLLQYDLILQVNKKLATVVSPSSGNIQQDIFTAKKTYFTLRLLEDLFRSFLTSLNANGLEEIFRAKPKETNTGILNMWKKNWMKDEVVRDEMSHLQSKYLHVLRGWCNRADEVLSFSLKESPLLSLVAQKCSSLAREIICKMEAVSSEKV